MHPVQTDAAIRRRTCAANVENSPLLARAEPPSLAMRRRLS